MHSIEEGRQRGHILVNAPISCKIRSLPGERGGIHQAGFKPASQEAQMKGDI